MPLQPIARRSVTDEVFAQLSAEVLNGDLAAGENLPSERRLAEVLGVSRPSVRQALQRLATAGLVDVRHGDATTVRDFRRTAGLSLLPQLLLAGGGLDVGVVRSILETRLLVGPFAAGLAAERGNTSLKPALDRALDELAGAADAVGRQRVALDFWDVIIDGADSITIRLMYNNLRSAYEPVIEALAHVMDAEALRSDTYRELAEAISDGDVARARETADALLRPSTDSLLAAFDNAEVKK
jgi:GntR family transcriptional regulator, transcriptional repressor for pyruvate dehydrogenase complex